MKLAHLSDLHFAAWEWSAKQFFSKRWIGNLNFIFGRKGNFDYERLSSLPQLLLSLQVSTVFITGDLSTTSAPAEFAKAQKFTSQFKNLGIEVLSIPGNHDHYTHSAYKHRLFYQYFPSSWGTGDLKTDGFTAKELEPGLWIVGLDTAIATSWLYSTGKFSTHTEQALDAWLCSLPASNQVIMINHFPFFQHEAPRKQLVNGERLQRLLEKYPLVKMYCHGHTHRKCIAPLQANNLPLILDPGSTASYKNGGWYLIDATFHNYHIQHYEWKEGIWVQAEKYELV